jgi:hypothetical protein
MNRLKLITIATLLFGCGEIYAQNGAFNGFCVKGATNAITSGLASSNTLQGVVPGGPAGCLVNVFLTGTVTPAVIYSNSSMGVLMNPFRATLSGQWTFYAATGQGYDVVMSGGLPPNTYTTPVTLTGISAGGSGGCGPLATDSSSTACGLDALSGSSGATSNLTGVGNYAGQDITDSSDVLALGSYAGQDIAGSSDVLALGSYAGNAAVNSSNLIEIGSDAAYGTTNSGNVVAIGSNAAPDLTNVQQVIALGSDVAESMANAQDIVALGDRAAPGLCSVQSSSDCTNSEIIALGTDAAATIANTTELIVIGDHAGGGIDGATVPPLGPGCAGDSCNIVGIGTNAANSITNGTDIVGVGDQVVDAIGYDQPVSAAVLTSQIIGIGYNSGGNIASASSDIIGIGENSGTSIGANSDDIIGIGQTAANGLGAASSDVIQIGHRTSGYYGTTMTDAIAIGPLNNTASNQILIGDPSITSLVVYGCPSGQTALDDGSGTCYTPSVGIPVSPTILYSAAGTPLPSCAVGIQGANSVVSDATAPTYMGAYTSGGGITAAVICSYDGTSYSWLTH